MKFVGRKEEIQSIEKICTLNQPTIGVVYGRRRIGKSFLIKKCTQNKTAYFFEGLENRSTKEQIQHFLFQFESYFGKQKNSKNISTWKSAFILLFEQIQKNPGVVVFDEFQWMANYRQAIVSDLKFVWDRYFAEIDNMTLLLCGSIASFMIEKLMKSTAMYGRIDLEINLQPFTIAETREMLSNKNIAECFEAQLLTGGVPKYLDLLNREASVRIGMEMLAFTSTGYFFHEYDRIFSSHFGRNQDYEKIVIALVQHPGGLFRNDISRYAKVSTGGLLTEHLNNLESAGFIKSYIPFNKNNNARYIKYFVSDAFIRFYWTFIEKNQRKVMDKTSTDFFNRIVRTGEFYNWLGKAFEYFCMQHANLIASILGFAAVDYSYGPYFQPSGTKNYGCQIDLLFSRSDNVISLCEIKNSQKTLGINIIKEVDKKVEIVQDISPRKTIQPILITAGAVSTELINSAYFYKIIRYEDFFGPS